MSLNKHVRDDMQSMASFVHDESERLEYMPGPKNDEPFVSLKMTEEWSNTFADEALNAAICRGDVSAAEERAHELYDEVPNAENTLRVFMDELRRYRRQEQDGLLRLLADVDQVEDKDVGGLPARHADGIRQTLLDSAAKMQVTDADLIDSIKNGDLHIALQRAVELNAHYFIRQIKSYQANFPA